MGAGAVIGTVGSVAAGVIGADKQGDAMRDAANTSAGVERWKTEESMALSQPMRDVGYAAMNTLASAYLPDWEGLHVPAPYGYPDAEEPSSGREGFGSFMGGFDALFGGSPEATEGYTPPGDRTLAPVDMADIGMLPWARELFERSNDEVFERTGRTGSRVGANALSAISDNATTNINALSMDPLFQLAGYGSQGIGMGANALMANQEGAALYAGGVSKANSIGAKYGSIANGINGAVDNWMTYQGVNGPQAPMAGRPTTAPYANPNFMGPPSPAPFVGPPRI